MHVQGTGIQLDFVQAYRKTADYCAMQDRCISEVRLKLKSWNTDSSFEDEIIIRLIAEGFIDEKRYAINFAGGKFRINGWGKLKIAAALRFRSIPSLLIKQALAAIHNDEYMTCLEILLEKKLKHSGDNSALSLQKAVRFAASRGFEMELIKACLKENEIIDI